MDCYNHFSCKVCYENHIVVLFKYLQRYIDANAEKLRHIFVEHEGKLKLEVEGGGNIYTANYPELIKQLSNEIDQHTKGIQR